MGFSILELSKLLMYRLWYFHLRPCFGGRLRLAMTDTDSWCFISDAASTDEALDRLASIRNFYPLLAGNGQEPVTGVMDFSNLPADHRLFSRENARSVGYLKSECPKAEIVAFAGARAKAYVLVTLAVTAAALATIVRAKGLPRADRSALTFDHYKTVITRLAAVDVRHRSIQSRNHVTVTVQARRRVFSSLDDKRALLCCKHSVPYSSWLVPFCSARAPPSARPDMDSLVSWCTELEAAVTSGALSRAEADRAHGSHDGIAFLQKARRLVREADTVLPASARYLPVLRQLAEDASHAARAFPADAARGCFFCRNPKLLF